MGYKCQEQSRNAKISAKMAPTSYFGAKIYTFWHFITSRNDVFPSFSPTIFVVAKYSANFWSVSSM